MTDALPALEPVPSFLSRVVGVIVSPRTTFERLISRPRAFGVIVLVGVVVGLSQGLPQLTETGRRASIDAAAQQTERFTGHPLTDEQYANLDKAAPYRTYGTMIFAPLLVGVSVVFFSALYFIAFNVVLGGTATFKQVVAVAAHGAIVSALGALIAAPVQYLQGTANPMGPFTLAALFPMLDDTTFIARLLGLIGVFSIWSTIVTSIGLSVLYHRKASHIVAALLTLTVLFFSVGVTVANLMAGR